MHVARSCTCFQNICRFTDSVPQQLPHHEHLLPEIPSESLKDRLYKDIKEADGQPKTIQAEVKLEQAKRDETNIRMAVHASLPACLDQVNLLPTYQQCY